MQLFMSENFQYDIYVKISHDKLFGGESTFQNICICVYVYKYICIHTLSIYLSKFLGEYTQYMQNY